MIKHNFCANATADIELGMSKGFRLFMLLFAPQQWLTKIITTSKSDNCVIVSLFSFVILTVEEFIVAFSGIGKLLISAPFISSWLNLNKFLLVGFIYCIALLLFLWFGYLMIHLVPYYHKFMHSKMMIKLGKMFRTYSVNVRDAKLQKKLQK